MGHTPEKNAGGHPPARDSSLQALTRFQIAVLVLTAAGAVVASVAGTRLTENREGVFLMRPAAGDVVFDHGAHIPRSDACATCHHDLWGAVSHDGCVGCHGDDVAADGFRHADHVERHGSGCGACHEEAGDQAASSCRGCHPAAQAESQTTRSCAECHDFDHDAVPLGHRDLIALHRGCGPCHAPRAVGAAYHAQCIACHVASDPARFQNDDGTPACGWCHLQ